MPSRPTPSKPSLNLRQELLGDLPSSSVLALALLPVAALSAGAVTPEATPTPRADAASSPVPERSDWMSHILIEGSADDYKPELANNPKRPEPLLNTPQSISVVPHQVIRDQNDTNLRDILRNIPGITVQAGEGGATPGDNFIIRGFSARTDVYVDGARDVNGFYRDPFNIEQVEVIKGPASVYNGRGSTGGTVNVITKQPLQHAFYEVDTTFGTANLNRETLDINEPFRLPWDKPDTSEGAADSPPTSAFRLNAVWHTQDIPGRDEAANQRWGVAPSLAFGLGTPTQVILQYSHLDQNNMPDFGVPWVTATNIPLTPYRNQPAPVDYSNYYGLNQRDHEFLRTDEVIGIVSHDFGDWGTLRNTFHYGRNSRDSVISAPRFISDASTDINREFQSRDEIDDVITDELDFTGHVRTFVFDHTPIAGFEWTHEDFQNRIRVTPATPLANLFDPDPNDPFVGKVARNGAVNEADTNTFGAYLFDTVKLGKSWQVSGGGRYDYFTADYDTRSATGAYVHYHDINKLFSWRAALLYKPLEIGSIYFGAGSSFNPSAEGLTLSKATQKLDPEKTTAYEFGTKWDLLNGGLSLNGAFFYTIKDNARTPGLTPADPPMVLQGEQQALGFDFEAKGHLTKDWEVIGGYTYTDTQIKHSNTPAEVGSELPGVPRHSLTLWSVYHFPWGIEAGFGTEYNSQRFANPINTRDAGGFYTFDAMAAYHVNKHLTLRVNVYNFTDEQYIDALHIQGSYGHFFPGERRSATLTASLQF